MKSVGAKATTVDFRGFIGGFLKKSGAAAGLSQN